MFKDMTHKRLPACSGNQQRESDKKLVGQAKQTFDSLIACSVPAIKVFNHDFVSIQ